MQLRKWIAIILLLGGLLTGCRAKESLPAITENKVQLPVVMYHAILKDPARQGKYVVSPGDLEADMRWLLANGYTTVFISDVIAYVEEGMPLPEKPVILTFDDGFFNNYTYAYPLAKQLGVKIMISPILSLTEEYTATGEKNPNYSYLPWDTLREMYESGYVEYGNHTYDLHGDSERLGVRRAAGESEEDYCRSVGEDLSRAQQLFLQRLGEAPECMVYPYGAYCEDSEDLIRTLGFKASMTCCERMNIVTDADSLFGLGRFLRPAGVSSEAFFTKILSAGDTA